MKNKIYPCLWFDNNAAEAAAFYCSVFPGAAIKTNTSLVVIMEIFGKKIMGLNGGPMFTKNPSISLFALCETLDETNRIWEKLSDGGSVLIPIGKYPWSERYGWLKDRFGMTWQISIVNKTGDPASLTPSFLFTDTRFGEAKAAAGLYTSLYNETGIPVMIYYPEGDPNAGKIMYSEIQILDDILILMDGPGNHAYTFNEGVSLVIDCSGQEEVDRLWEKLIANGGEESRCGWLKDRYGVSWQIVPSRLPELMMDPDRQKAERVMQAMLKMNKIIVAELEAAAAAQPA